MTGQNIFYSRLFVSPLPSWFPRFRVSLFLCVGPHIYIHTYTHTHIRSTYIRTHRSAHIPGASSPWRLNFVRPQYGICCMSPFWSLGIFSGSPFKKKKKKLCPPVYILITKALNYLASLCVTQLFPITTFFQLLAKLAGGVAKYP